MTRLLSLCLAALALLALLAQWLSPAILAEQRAWEERRLLAPLAGLAYDNQPLQEPLAVTAPLMGAWQVRLRGAPVARLLRLRTPGYEGPIELLLATDAHGRLHDLSLLQQAETPGLAALDEAAGQAWLASLRGRTATQLRLSADGGEVDAIAGATRTSRAVVDALRAALTQETPP